jgi:iron complex transport system substrate-binding protein
MLARLRIASAVTLRQGSMMRLLRCSHAVLLLAFIVCAGTRAGSAASAAFKLRDDTQREVTFPQHPQRIVAMLPSFTETICALNACGRLVATDRFSNWPLPVRDLPKAGGLEDAEVEMIVGVQPDLVLLARSQQIGNRLRELGIPIFVLEARTYADIRRTVGIIGAILGLEDRALRLNDTIDAAVQGISTEEMARSHDHGPTVYFEVDRAPFAAGATSFIGELLALLGARNIVTPDLGPFPKLNPEYVVRSNPDVIFASPTEIGHLAERPGWSEVRAVRERRLCSFTPEVRDTIVRPGPRVAEGMRAMADCLRRVAP